MESVYWDFLEKSEIKVLQESVDHEDSRELGENLARKEILDQREIQEGLGKTVLKDLLDSQALLGHKERRVIKVRGVSLE